MISYLHTKAVNRNNYLHAVYSIFKQLKETKSERGRKIKGRIDAREKQGIGKDTITFLIY